MGQGQGFGMQPGISAGQGQGQGVGAGQAGPGWRDPNVEVGKLNGRRFKAGDWARFRGRLRNDVLEGASIDTPEEYRDLINRYFKAVARQGKKATNDKSKKKK